MHYQYYKYYLPALFCLLFIPLSWLLYSNFNLGDDSFIYLQYVKHIIDSGEISFNPGMRTYGFTSPLWLGFMLLLTPFIDNLTLIPQLLSLFFSTLTIWIWFLIFDKTIRSPFYISFLMIFILFEPNLLKHSFLGMEASFSFFLSSAILYLIIDKEKILRKGLVIISIAFSFYLLLRPDSALLIMLIIIYLLYENKIAFRDLFVIAVIVTTLVLPWHVFAYSYFETFIPTTFGAKGASFTLGKIFTRHLFDSMKIFGGYYFYFIPIVILYVRKNKEVQISKDKVVFYVFSLIIILFYIIFYSLVLNREFVYARYYCMVFPFINYFAITLFDQVPQNISYYYRMYLYSIIILVVSVLLYSYLTTKIYSSGESEEDEIIEWVQNNTETDSIIIRPRIGKIGFFTNRIIVDPMGLVNPQILGYIKNNNEIEYYELRKPDYYIGDEKFLTSKIANLAEFKILKVIVHNNPTLLRELFSTDSLNYESKEVIAKLHWKSSL